ncbi:hypothetical protein Tco_1016886 [Tanacetum coccineum]|uniref:Zinc finger, CCHC-type n=1 Tax=Tanacetum coccineum TaxID=301880 RepID=A0ABQ5FPX3_9ASTR
MFVDLTQDDTKTQSPKHKLSSPSAPNAPSKTPSTKGTSSSSIDYIPKSPTSSTSPSTNGYLNSPTSPPPRVPPPPPTQENASMDITLTLSLITPLDIQFATPSPSSPIFGHPIPWNLLEVKVALNASLWICCDSMAFRFYVTEPNDSVAINSIIKSRDAIFDENRFSSVLRPSQRSLVNETKDIGALVVPEKVTEEVVQQSEPDLRKSKRHMSPKDFGPEFQLYLIEGTRDEVSDQYSYCFNVVDDPKIFDEAMKSQDVDFWKEAINDEMDSIMGNNTWVLADLPSGCKPLGCKWIFKRKLKVDGTVEKFKASLIIHQRVVKTAFLNGELDEEALNQWHQNFDEVVLSNGYLLNQADKCVRLTKEFLSSRFSVNDMGKVDVILGIRIKHESNGIAISQARGRVLKYLKKTMDYRLTYTSYPSVLEGYTDASWISNTKENSSTSGWVFLLGGGTISWASKKQTCITGSTMESEFVALAAAGKEAEWLKNFLLEIPLWSKPIAPISIRCDSATSLEKAYSQMYNRKSRHLCVRHSMIRELITNGVISIEFVRSQQNLADHLTMELAIDLVIKSAKGMGLNGLKHMHLHIIPRMCLEPAKKEDEVVNFLMVNLFEKVLSRSMDKEEPPTYSNGLKGSILRTP